MTKVTRRRAVTGASVVALATLVTREVAAQDAESDVNRAVVRRLFDEVYNGGALDVLDELLSADFMGDDPDAAPGIDGYKQAQAAVRTQYERFFASYEFEPTDVAADGSLVFVRMTLTGEQIGDGKDDVTTQGFLEAALADGKIIRIWSLVDVAALTEQLS